MINPLQFLHPFTGGLQNLITVRPELLDSFRGLLGSAGGMTSIVPPEYSAVPPDIVKNVIYPNMTVNPADTMLPSPAVESAINPFSKVLGTIAPLLGSKFLERVGQRAPQLPTPPPVNVGANPAISMRQYNDPAISTRQYTNPYIDFISRRRAMRGF